MPAQNEGVPIQISPPQLPSLHGSPGFGGGSHSSVVLVEASGAVDTVVHWSFGSHRAAPAHDSPACANGVHAPGQPEGFLQ
jgi:hypothetical protein